MPYLGNQPSSGGYHKLDSLTASATDTYALTLGGSAYYPATANQLLVSLNGVIQAPQDSFTISGSNIVFASALSASDSIDFIMSFGDVYGVGTPADGTITDAKIQSMAASKLTGALPAISGANLTNLPSGGKLLKHAVNIIDTQLSRNSATFGQIADFGSFTPSSTNSKIIVQGHAYFGVPASTYFGVRWVVDGTNYVSTGSYSSVKTFSHYGTNGYSNWVSPVLTEITNTDGSAITVTMDSSSGATLYINRSSSADNGSTAGAAGISAVAFYEIDNS